MPLDKRKIDLDYTIDVTKQCLQFITLFVEFLNCF